MDVNEELKFCENLKKKLGGGGSRGGGGRVGWDQVGCERRIEVFVKIQNNFCFFWGWGVGGGGRGRGLGGSGWM